MSLPADSTRVTLYSSPMPWPISFAMHYWFVVESGETVDRIEIWAPMWIDGTVTVARNILPPKAGFRSSYLYSHEHPWRLNPVSVVQIWEGNQDGIAGKLASVLNQAERMYPYVLRYRLWPGPNSNTFIAWVFKQAGVTFALSWRAFGKNYPVHL